MVGKKNRIILITGGRQGLGKSLVHQFITRGETVISTSRSFSFSPSSPIKTNSVTEQYLDVTNENSVVQLFSWLHAENRTIDVLINNAGVGVFHSLEETTLSDWELTIKTNLTGAFLCMREACKIMKDTGGRIINIGSIADMIPVPDNAAYGASKSGLRGLSKIVAEESKFHKIRVTHFSLGAVATEIWRGRGDFFAQDMLEPEMVANCIADIALLPLEMRIDHIELTPEKGIL